MTEGSSSVPDNFWLCRAKNPTASASKSKAIRIFLGAVFISCLFYCSGFGFPKIPVATGTTAEHPPILSKIDRDILRFCLLDQLSNEWTVAAALAMMAADVRIN